ncbi:type II/IV secretion system protein [Candidatus Parcubacteria bacterium]|nr:MAG: type II/IV secretion system protein [Candidatus Parcubacteria bacterium]
MTNTGNIIIGRDQASDKLAEKLSSIELKEKEKETEEQAAKLGMSYINLDKFPISQDAIKIIPREQAESLQTVCFLYTGEEMRLASLNPSNPQVSNVAKELSEKHHARVKVYFISPNSFEIAFKIYEKIPTILQFEGVNITEDDIKKYEDKLKTFQDLQGMLNEISLTEMINLIISAGLKFSASDIHIETEADNVKTRFRVDGMLHEIATLPKESIEKIGSRIKLLSGLKLNLGNKPQDGRFTITLSAEKVEVRVSIIPTAYGESIVMRLLKASAVGLEFESLGVKGKSFNDLKEQMTKPNGMIITTGPTGSGKTTTLYAILNKLNSPDRKIITLEDPIEYKLPGIVQSQVEGSDTEDAEDETVGGIRTVKRGNRYTFARGLRAILRQDPDMVMVGEIRDLETAETAINAALTGHLMLSTLHTNSSAGAIPRLLAMGVQSFLLAPALNAIVGQRLVRKLCDSCKSEDKSIDNKTMTTIMNTLNEIAPESGYKPSDLTNLKFYTSQGCEKCHGLGYKGRIGIYEILTMSPKVEQMILSGSISEYELEKQAVKDGMITMLQDGLLKALDGVTSIEEIFREVKD